MFRGSKSRRQPLVLKRAARCAQRCQKFFGATMFLHKFNVYGRQKFLPLTASRPPLAGPGFSWRRWSQRASRATPRKNVSTSVPPFFWGRLIVIRRRALRAFWRLHNTTFSSSLHAAASAYRQPCPKGNPRLTTCSSRFRTTQCVSFLALGFD